MTGRGARLGLLCLPRSVASAVADAKLAEEVGFSLVGVADSQSVFRELYATMALCAQATRRVRIGPSVTNPITRHPAVAASGIATIEEIVPGRDQDGARLERAPRLPVHPGGQACLRRAGRRDPTGAAGYQPAVHEALGPSPNARLLEAEPVLRAYLADRFAVVGPPAACAEKLSAVGSPADLDGQRWWTASQTVGPLSSVHSTR